MTAHTEGSFTSTCSECHQRVVTTICGPESGHLDDCAWSVADEMAMCIDCGTAWAAWPRRRCESCECERLEAHR